MRYTPVELRHVKIGRSTLGGYRKLETEKLLEDIADSDRVRSLARAVTGRGPRIA